MLLEQLFGRRAVGFDALDVGFDAGDFGVERRDARVQFLDRNRVEVLPAKRDQRIVGLAREKFVEIHGANRLTRWPAKSISRGW